MILLKRPAFFRDLNHCTNYIAQDNPDAAQRLLSAVEAASSLLATQPGIVQEENFRKRAGIRSWRVPGFENYLIFYRVNPDCVEILRLLHGAQNLPKFFPPV